jgi:ASC-1-like (ASCH) protein
MTREMKLRHEPFAAIKEGKGNVEVHLNDDKRKEIEVGDNVVNASIRCKSFAGIKKFGQGTKADFIKLIVDKLSDVLTIAQKERKVKYLILKLQQAEVIERTNSKERVSGWGLKR